VFRVDLGATDGQLQPDAQGATGAVVVREVLFYLAAHLAHAERVLADATWDALRRPAPGDDADQGR